MRRHPAITGVRGLYGKPLDAVCMHAPMECDAPTISCDVFEVLTGIMLVHLWWEMRYG